MLAWTVRKPVFPGKVETPCLWIEAYFGNPDQDGGVYHASVFTHPTIACAPALQLGEPAERGRSQRALQSPHSSGPGSAEDERTSGAMLRASACVGDDVHDWSGDQRGHVLDERSQWSYHRIAFVIGNRLALEGEAAGLNSDAGAAFASWSVIPLSAFMV